jgi:hypothetical protein
LGQIELEKRKTKKHSQIENFKKPEKSTKNTTFG